MHLIVNKLAYSYMLNQWSSVIYNVLVYRVYTDGTNHAACN